MSEDPSNTGRPPLDREVLEAALVEHSAHSVPRPDCPPPEALWDAAHGEGSAEERRAAVDHMATCGACAEAWRLARELSPAAASSDEKETGAPPELGKVLRPAVSRWRAWRPLAAAAMVVLAVGLLFVLRQQDSGPPIDRGSETTIEALTGEGALARGDALLSWTPAQEGATYTVTVTTEALETLIQVEGLTNPRLALKPSTLSHLEPGTVLLWRVEAELPEGGHLASTTFVTRLE